MGNNSKNCFTFDLLVQIYTTLTNKAYFRNRK